MNKKIIGISVIVIIAIATAAAADIIIKAATQPPNGTVPTSRTQPPNGAVPTSRIELTLPSVPWPAVPSRSSVLPRCMRTRSATRIARFLCSSNRTWEQQERRSPAAATAPQKTGTEGRLVSFFDRFIDPTTFFRVVDPTNAIGALLLHLLAAAFARLIAGGCIEPNPGWVVPLAGILAYIFGGGAAGAGAGAGAVVTTATSAKLAFTMAKILGTFGMLSQFVAPVIVNIAGRVDNATANTTLRNGAGEKAEMLLNASMEWPFVVYLTNTSLVNGTRHFLNNAESPWDSIMKQPGSGFGWLAHKLLAFGSYFDVFDRLKILNRCFPHVFIMDFFAFVCSQLGWLAIEAFIYSVTGFFKGIQSTNHTARDYGSLLWGWTIWTRIW